MIRLPAAIAAWTCAGASCGAAASPSGRIRAADPGVVGPAATQPGCGGARVGRDRVAGGLCVALGELLDLCDVPAGVVVGVDRSGQSPGAPLACR